MRFVLDTHLGQLAVYLRMLGFDAVYSNDATDAVLAGISSAERRVLLTRDRGLLKRKIVEYGYCVRQTEPRAQLVCVLRRYDLAAAAQPWRRCVHCNGLLHPVDKAAILDRLEPKTKRYYDEFQQCEACGRSTGRGRISNGCRRLSTAYWRRRESPQLLHRFCESSPDLPAYARGR